MEPIDLLTIGLRAVGAVGGTILIFVFQPPKTRTEFWTRLVFSLLSGVLFGEAVHDWLQWRQTGQMIVASAALTSMISWTAWGAITKAVLRFLDGLFKAKG